MLNRDDALHCVFASRFHNDGISILSDYGAGTDSLISDYVGTKITQSRVSKRPYEALTLLIIMKFVFVSDVINVLV